MKNTCFFPNLIQPRKKLALPFWIFLCSIILLIGHSCNAPFAAFTVMPHEGKAPLEVQLDASSSFGLRSPIISYKWDMGDGDSTSGKNVTHVFFAPGVYKTKLTVTNELQKSRSTIRKVTVLPTNIPEDVKLISFENSLERRGKLIKKADPGAIMVSESDFVKAINESKFYQVDEIIKKRAVDLSANANNPGSLGIFSEMIIADQTEFVSGTLFIVVKDPSVTPDGKIIQGTDFFVAALELTIQTRWKGVNPSFSIDPSLSSSLGSVCCGPSQLGQMGGRKPPLGPIPVGPHGGDPCDPTGANICPAMELGIVNQKTESIRLREQNSLPSISLLLFRSKPDNFDQSLLNENKPVANIYTISNFRDPCSVVKPICESGDNGFADAGGSRGGNGNPCGGAGDDPGGVYDNDIPEVCKIIFDAGSLPVECGGYGPSIGKPGESIELTGTGLPPYPRGCLVMYPSDKSDLCGNTPSQIAIQNQVQMQLRAGWYPGSGSKRNCETIMNGRGAVKCTECDAAGNCRETFDIPKVDPFIAGEDQTGERQNLHYETIVVGRRYEGETNSGDHESDSSTPVGEINSRVIVFEDPTTIFGDVTPESYDYRTENLLDHFGKGGHAADPILLGDGSFELQQIDLSFEGPVRPFQFIRNYNSRSQQRSFLGSNWHHNWDVWIQPLDIEISPTWLLPFASGSSETPSALYLHTGDGGKQLFYLDLKTRLYMPQAGNTSTVAQTSDDGWALRFDDGHVMYFNKYGYLTKDQDRFGNSFYITYEPTPLFTLYEYFCSDSILTSRNETRYSRRNAVLSYLVEGGFNPEANSEAWQVNPADFPLPDSTHPDYHILAYSKAYFFYLLSLGPNVESVHDNKKFRPAKVEDDLGRFFEFSYYEASPLNVELTQFDFINLPYSGLLREVRGPAETHLKFEYDRPSTYREISDILNTPLKKYPKELNEYFLTKVNRSDSIVANDIRPGHPRNINYKYQWPEGPSESFNKRNYPELVYSRFLDYYRTFVGCSFRLNLGCGNFGSGMIAPGNPFKLAEREKNKYISDVADNIIQVINNGETDSETRYVLNPLSENFDHAVTQRYGSTFAHQNPVPQITPSVLPTPILPSNNWQTNLPEASIAYQSAGPTGEGMDLTDAFLPTEIREKYPLETAPATSEKIIPQPADGANITNETIIRACDYTLMEAERKNLPGYKETIPYYIADSLQRHTKYSSRLFRTRLTPEQLAIAQLSDPTHNDLLSTLEPDTTTLITTDHYAVRLLGRREIIFANMNRICRWAHVINRDQDVTYYGLNYRGQVLVTAVKEKTTGNYIFTESTYNADGMLIQKRRPTTGQHPWTTSAGHTNYYYDEINPLENRGWNEWLPVYWSRRMNLLRIEEMPQGEKVLDEDEFFSGNFKNTYGRYERFTYEPLFNQLKSIEKGSIEKASGSNLAFKDIPHSRLDFIFDYQELTLDSTFNSVLDKFLPWGFNWASTWDSVNQKYYYDYDIIKSWQLPLNFYSDDLNQDGVLGFGYGVTDSVQVRSVPVISINKSLIDTTLVLINAMMWAPHGKISGLFGQDGSATIFEYYPLGTSGNISTLAYGQNRIPTDQEVSTGFRSFLARVRTKVNSSSYNKSYGPPVNPCNALAGPYQWLLPENCSNPEAALQALGLTAEMVSVILNSTSNNLDENWLSTSYSYSEIGYPSRFWSENRMTSFIFDTDGRKLEMMDPQGGRIVQSYTTLGYPERTIQTDNQGVLLGDTYRKFDYEGRLLYECNAEIPGGCQPLGSLNPTAGVVKRYEYWSEGSLYKSVDPEGLETIYDYNERQLPIRISTSHQGQQSVTRQKKYFYDLDDKILRVEYGFKKATGPEITVFTEHYGYDGLQRLNNLTDARKYKWQFAYSSRDLITRYKQDHIPYGAAMPSNPSRETQSFYDGLGRKIRQVESGIETTDYYRTTTGLIYKTLATGFGDSYASYDHLGRLVWARDPAGNQTVNTFRENPQVVSTAVIRTSDSGALHTNAVTVEHDDLGLPVKETHYGQGMTQVWTWNRDGQGFVVEETNPEGYVKKIARNLLGWPMSILEQRTDGVTPEYDVAQLSYNKRGQVTELIDPALQKTNYFFDVFGAMIKSEIPGNPVVLAENFYDEIGRLSLEQKGGFLIKHVYDHRGDAIADSLYSRIPSETKLAGGTWKFEVIAEREYDELGRLHIGRNYNPAMNFLPLSERVVENRMMYDRLGRVKMDGLQIGSNTTNNVYSTWSVLPNDIWQRKIEYRAQNQMSTLLETFDLSGKLEKKERIVTGNSSLLTSFDWQGEIYVGRSQQQSGKMSPFREQREIDAFGRYIHWKYNAIDLDQNMDPVYHLEGSAYCGGPWDKNECTRPLFEMSALRDVVGRITSLKWSFGNPVFKNNSLVPSNHPRPWQGYIYNPKGQLAGLWENDGVGNEVLLGSIASHTVTKADIEQLGANSERWDYARQPEVGNTSAIRNIAAGKDRWDSNNRAPGHQLNSFKIDGNKRQITHDQAGNVRSDAKFIYSFDPRGQLASVYDIAGNHLESYLYDISGRLVALYNGNPAQLAYTFAYDGVQMVASYDYKNNPAWEAIWGPGLDQLIEWRDYRGGKDYIPLVDHRNSVVAAWNVQQGRLTNTAYYNPEGRLSIQDSEGLLICREEGSGQVCQNPAAMPFGFGSAWRSQISGLVYMRNRWYSTETGQFISHDPSGYVDSYNLYAYVGFDPINGWDPYGLDTKSFASTTSTGETSERGPKKPRSKSVKTGKQILVDEEMRIKLEYLSYKFRMSLDIDNLPPEVKEAFDALVIDYSDELFRRLLNGSRAESLVEADEMRDELRRAQQRPVDEAYIGFADILRSLSSYLTLRLVTPSVKGNVATFKPASKVASQAEGSVAKVASPVAEEGAGLAAKTSTRFVSTAEGVVHDLKPTLDRIASGGKFPHRNDGSIFKNMEGLLPKQNAGYYKEFVHPTPGVKGPGAMRVVTGQGGEMWFTPDHYKTFIQIR